MTGKNSYIKDVVKRIRLRSGFAMGLIMTFILLFAVLFVHQDTTSGQLFNLFGLTVTKNKIPGYKEVYLSRDFKDKKYDMLTRKLKMKKSKDKDNYQARDGSSSSYWTSANQANPQCLYHPSGHHQMQPANLLSPRIPDTALQFWSVGLQSWVIGREWLHFQWII